ncbi:MAG: gamma-glutamyl-gamma-aminobutyrate hydrolase family protein [Kofleriaceae bacterium]
MIYLVDNSLDGKGTSPRELAAAFAQLRPQTPLVRDHYTKASLARIAELAPTHIVLSGQPDPWTRYRAEDLAGVFEIIRQARQPILGVCGGHQQIALCFGGEVRLMKRLIPGEGYTGALRVRGFREVELYGHGLFAGLPTRVSIWHSHCEEVPVLPPDFAHISSSKTCRIEGMQHRTRPLFGVQFHPELFDHAHPHGRRILENFLGV